MVKICVPILVTSIAELQSQLLVVLKNIKVDLLEIRLDYFQDIDDIYQIDSIFSLLNEQSVLPYIITLRTRCEGGNYQGNMTQYQRIYQYILENYHFYAIDIELQYALKFPELIDMTIDRKMECIVSYHNFENVPDDNMLEIIYQKMCLSNATIYKIAVMPLIYHDITRLLNLVEKLDKQKQYIIIAMGSLGLVSRIMPNLFCSIITFASSTYYTAPGQIAVNKLLDILDVIESI